MSSSESRRPPRPGREPASACAVALACACALAITLGAGCTTPPPAPAPAPPPPQPVAAAASAPAPLPPPAPVPPLEPRDLAARHLLQTQARLAALTPADLAAEIARAKPETPQASVDLALALAIERGPGDLARAQALLEPLVKDEGEAAQPWRALARWLAARIADQRRSDDQIERLNQQLRDTQRRLDQANDKLAALKAIERSLVTRPGTAASRPGQ